MGGSCVRFGQAPCLPGCEDRLVRLAFPPDPARLFEDSCPGIVPASPHAYPQWEVKIVAQDPRPHSKSCDVKYAKTVVLEEPIEPVGEAVSDEARRVSDAAMPWVISGLAHLAIILIAVFIGAMVTIDHIEQDELIVPTLRPMPNDDVSVLVNTAALPVMNSQASTFAQPPPTPDPAKRPEDPLALIGVVGSPNINVPGTKPARMPGLGDDGIFRGDDDPNGLPPGGGGPRSVVYVIDASGSMIDQFDSILKELRKAIQDLGPADRFTVLFFQDEQVVSLKPVGLRPATRSNVDSACQWAGVGSANVVPSGSSNPMPAIRRALAMRPSEVWLLSDNITGKGRHALEAEQLLSEVDQLRRVLRADRTRVHTIQFLHADAHGTLAELSKRTGGIHRFVKETDLE